MTERNDNLFLGGDVTEDFFLATLNRERDFRMEREHFRSRYGSVSGLDEAFAVISDALPLHLSRHADAWIASGRNVGGLWEVPHGRMLDFDTWNRVTGWKDLQRASTITVSKQSGKVSLDLRAFENEGTPIADPDEYAAQEADRMFLWFLNEGELSRAIAQCAECLHFYFRVKPHQSYKRACFCPNCRPKASVRRRMREVRKDKENSVIQAAIEAHNKWLQLSLRSRARFKDEDAYIIKQIGTVFGVTGNWLTRHRHQIINDQPAPRPSSGLHSQGVDR
jgi:hypothetical protein